jgi:hypothetical protein
VAVELAGDILLYNSSGETKKATKLQSFETMPSPPHSGMQVKIIVAITSPARGARRSAAMPCPLTL